MLVNTWLALHRIVGSAAYAEGLASLPVDVRTEIEQATSISWVRMGSSIAFVDAAALAAMRDPDLVYDEVVKRSVEMTYGGVWRVLIRFTTAETLVTRAALLYSKSRDTGKLDAALLRPGLAELRVTEWPRMLERYIRSIAITSKTLLLLSGEREVSATHAATRDGAIIRVRWGVAASSR